MGASTCEFDHLQAKTAKLDAVNFVKFSFN